MPGINTVEYSAIRDRKCQVTGLKWAAIPALNPGVSYIHVRESANFVIVLNK